MSQIVTTPLGRFRHIIPEAWLFECPGCREWIQLTEPQWEGRHYVYDGQRGHGCTYYERHDYRAALLAAQPEAQPSKEQSMTEVTHKDARQPPDWTGYLSLGQVTLIKLGLEVIGEQQRVDPVLLADYDQLRQDVKDELYTRFPPEAQPAKETK